MLSTRKERYRIFASFLRSQKLLFMMPCFFIWACQSWSIKRKGLAAVLLYRVLVTWGVKKWERL